MLGKCGNPRSVRVSKRRGRTKNLRVESRGLCGENKVVTERTFINFRGPQALSDRVESRGLCGENKVVTERTFINFRGPQALSDRLVIPPARPRRAISTAKQRILPIFFEIGHSASGWKPLITALHKNLTSPMG